VHQALCGRWPPLCGNALAFYRSRTDGAWRATGTWVGDTGATVDLANEAQNDWPAYIEIARAFVARLPVERRCIVLTLVPSGETRRAEATAIAQAPSVRER
jgi:hypothetical protein